MHCYLINLSQSIRVSRGGHQVTRFGQDFICTNILFYGEIGDQLNRLMARLLVCSSARLHLPANWANSRQFLVKARGFVLQPFLLERLDVIVKPRKLTRKEISFLCWGFVFFLFENINEIWNMSKRFSSTSNKITCTGHDNNFVTIFYRYKTGNSTSWLPSLHYYTLAVYFTQ